MRCLRRIPRTSSRATRTLYGVAYLKKGGEDARGFADLDKAVALKPDNLDCYKKKADAYKERGNAEQEIAALDKIIPLEARNSVVLVYTRRAELHLKRGSNDKALADYSSALEIEPTSIWILSTRAELLEKMGPLDQAIADYDKLLSLKPDMTSYAAIRDRLIKAKDSAPATAAAPATTAPDTAAPTKAEECSWWSSLLGRCAKTGP